MSAEEEATAAAVEHLVNPENLAQPAAVEEEEAAAAAEHLVNPKNLAQPAAVVVAVAMAEYPVYQAFSCGSGTNKQDVVDSEGQSVFKKRRLSWSLSPCIVLTVRARLWCAIDMPPVGNNCIAAVPVDGKAVRTRLPTPINRADTDLCVKGREEKACARCGCSTGPFAQTISP